MIARRPAFDHTQPTIGLYMLPSGHTHAPVGSGIAGMMQPTPAQPSIGS